MYGFCSTVIILSLNKSMARYIMAYPDQRNKAKKQKELGFFCFQARLSIRDQI